MFHVSWRSSLRSALPQNRRAHVCDRKFALWFSRLKATFLLHCAPLNFDTSLCQTIFVFLSTPRFASLCSAAWQRQEAKRGLTKARVKTERSAVQQKVALRWENHSANFRSQTCPPRFCWRAPPPPPALLKVHPLHALPLASRTKTCRRFALMGLSRLQPTSPMFHVNCQLAYVPLSRFFKGPPPARAAIPASLHLLLVARKGLRQLFAQSKKRL